MKIDIDPINNKTSSVTTTANVDSIRGIIDEMDVIRPARNFWDDMCENIYEEQPVIYDGVTFYGKSRTAPYSIIDAAAIGAVRHLKLEIQTLRAENYTLREENDRHKSRAADREKVIKAYRDEENRNRK